MSLKTLVLFFMVLMVVSCSSKIPPNSHPITDLKDVPVMAESKKQSLRLGIGDEIMISIWRHEELKRSVKIDLNGNINLLLVGELYAANRSIEELRKEIGKAYSKYIVKPHVDVSPITLTSKQFIILGEVKNPGNYQLKNEIGIIEAISTAGGATKDANANILLIRKNKDVVNVYVAKLNYMDLAAYSYVKVNSQDIIYVPSSVIADVEAFMIRVGRIISPLLDVQRSVILWPDFIDSLQSEEGDGTDVIFGR